MDDAQVITTIKNDLGWIQKHERILIVLMVLLAGVFCWNRYVNYAADHAHLVATVATQQLDEQKKANVQTANQVQQAAIVYQQTITALTQQNAQLATAISKRNQALTAQQGTDKTLPLPDLANRWQSIAGLQPGDLTATQSGIVVSDIAARTTVEQLDRIPVLESDLVDTQNIADNNQRELDKANGLIGGLNAQVVGLAKQTTDQDNACKAEVASVKADAQKSKMRWFKAGVVVGFVSGLFIGHKIP